MTGRPGASGPALRPKNLSLQDHPHRAETKYLTVAHTAAEVDQLRAAGLRVRNDIITGPGDSQILLGNPAGNTVELRQPAW